jgi:tRNA A37 threonylcarbamoyladenosine dehydratase
LPKVEVMARRILDINPNCDVTAHQCFYLPQTANRFDFSAYDYVVDAVDTVTAKLQLVARAKEAGTPIICSMGAANKLDPTAFRVADVDKTSICPLARIMRKEARKRGIRGLTVLFSDEQPSEVQGKRDAIDERGFVRDGASVLGTMSYFPPIMGQMLAGYVIRDLAGLM